MVIPRGYKQTDVGVIPEDWYTDKLYGLVDVNSGESPSKFNITNGDTPYFKVEQLNNCSKYLSKTPYKVNSARKIIKGSSIFPKRGASILLNKVRILKYDSYFDTNLMSLTPKSDALTSEYLYYFLIHVELWRIADTTSIPQINNKHIKEVIISLPPKAEQNAIANVLTHIDDLLASLEKLIEKKRVVKQGAMQELLTGKKRLPEFNGGWYQTTISSVLSIGHGKSQKEIEDINGKYSILATSGEIGRTNEFIYDKPSVLIGRKGTIDKPQYMDKPFWTIDTLFYTIIKTDYSVKYLYYLFCIINWASYNEASGVPSLNSKIIEDIDIIIPPSLSEQSAIADILTNMDDEIEQLEQKLHKYEEIKIGMMQNLLTGKIRLSKT